MVKKGNTACSDNLRTDKQWSDKKTLLTQLQRLWDKGLLLQELMQESPLFPKRLIFKSPNSKALSNEFESVRHWINDIQKLNGFRIVYKTVKHRVIGENSLPYEAWIDDLETAIQLLNRQNERDTFSQLLAQTRKRAPQLIDWIEQYPLKALSLADVWDKLLDFVLWRQQHSDPGIYLRQVSLPEIDTKFIENHRSILMALLNQSLSEGQINHHFNGARQFEQRFGFLKKPEGIRFRFFESDLAKMLITLQGSDMDITLTAHDFSLLHHQQAFIDNIQRVFITENEINFLTFPAQKNSLIIFGSGYGFDALAHAQWLSQKEIIYWGDIDTHGFAILDQLRSKFPHVKSLLMDENTLIVHQASWGVESKPERRELSRLLPNEQHLYQALLSNKYQPNLRLEQERVDFEYLINALNQVAILFK